MSISTIIVYFVHIYKYGRLGNSIITRPRPDFFVESSIISNQSLVLYSINQSRARSSPSRGASRSFFPPPSLLLAKKFCSACTHAAKRPRGAREDRQPVITRIADRPPSLCPSTSALLYIRYIVRRNELSYTIIASSTPLPSQEDPPAPHEGSLSVSSIFLSN